MSVNELKIRDIIKIEYIDKIKEDVLELPAHDINKLSLSVNTVTLPQLEMLTLADKPTYTSMTQKGDKFVKDIMTMLENYSIRDTSYIPHNADLRLNDIIMIEVKNYRSIVPQKEVDK